MRGTRTDHDVYLLTIIVTEDDFKEFAENEKLNAKLYRFEDIHMDIYL
jgi:hypothetical protein